jgi:hypothetical protein
MPRFAGLVAEPLGPGHDRPAKLTVSVVIVTYEVRDLVVKCLASLRGAADIVVVDNASKDGTAAAVADSFPNVTLIANEANLGFGAAVNQGAAVARGDLILILNPDTELGPQGLGEMADAMTRRPRAAIIGFRQVDQEGTPQLVVGPRPSFVLELLRMVLQRRIDQGDRRLAGWVDRRLRRARRVPWVSGAALLIRASCFRAIRGFDESFFLYYEDADLCLRASSVGDVWYEPGITVTHYRGRSAAQNAVLASQAYRESQLRYWRRYRGTWAVAVIDRYQRLRRVSPGGGR